MPVYEIETGGKTFEVEAPNEKSAASAVAGQSSPTDVARDVAKSTGAGLARGAIGFAGMIPDIAGAMKSAANRFLFDPVLSAAFGPQKQLPAGEGPPDLNKMFGSGSIKDAVESATGKFYEPQTTAGKYAQSVGEMLPGAIAAPGSLGMRVASGIGAGVGSETAGRLSEGSKLEPYARVAGAIMGGMSPTMLARGVTPIPAATERMNNVGVLRNAGIEPTAGQATGNEALRYAESMLGNAPFSGGKAAAAEAANLENFTSAILSGAGETATRATPDVMRNMGTRIGKQFEDLSARNTLLADTQMGADFLQTARDYVSKTLPELRASGQRNIEGILMGVINDMKANGGAMSGELYQATRSRIGDMAQAARMSDPPLAEALRGVRRALDSTMERSIAANNPSDLGAWGTARQQYRNMLIIEKALGGAGANNAEGLISPQQFRTAVANQDKRAYLRGDGDYAELARAAANILAPLPNSGTAQRATATAIPAALGAAIGAATGTPAALGVGAMAGSALGSVAPGISGRVLMSRPVQSYLSNQVLSELLRNDRPVSRSLLEAVVEANRPQISSDAVNR